MTEKEPQFREISESIEDEPKQPSPDTSRQREEPRVAALAAEREAPKPVEHTTEVSVSFENLQALVGKNISFRDPHTQPNRTDDPYRKSARIEQHNDKFVLVVDRGRYYPYYTGDRQNIFALSSQDDINYYEIKIEG